MSARNTQAYKDKKKNPSLSPLCPSVFFAHMPDTDASFPDWWICVCQHGSRECLKQSQLSCWPVTFSMWNDVPLPMLLSRNILLDIKGRILPLCATSFSSAKLIQTRGNTSDDYTFNVDTKNTVINPSPQCSLSPSSYHSGFDILFTHGIYYSIASEDSKVSDNLHIRQRWKPATITIYLERGESCISAMLMQSICTRNRGIWASGHILAS